MKLLLALTTIFNIATFNNFANVAKSQDNIVFNRATDEELLETTFYEAGSKPYKTPLITINKKTWDTKTNSIEYKINYDLLYKMIYEQAKSSGLFDGTTPFEKIKKDNLFIDARSLMIDKIEFKYLNAKTKKLITRKSSNVFKYRSREQLLTQDTPSFIFDPVSAVKEMNINLQPGFTQIIFADIKNVFISRESGSISYHKGENDAMKLYDLFKKPGLTKDEEETYSKNYSQFLTNLQLAFTDEHRIASDDFDIVKTNQGSEKFGYLARGYNLKVAINIKEEKPTFPIHLLLLPLLLILGPYFYFTIKRVINK